MNFQAIIDLTIIKTGGGLPQFFVNLQDWVNLTILKFTTHTKYKPKKMTFFLTIDNVGVFLRFFVNFTAVINLTIIKITTNTNYKP